MEKLTSSRALLYATFVVPVIGVAAVVLTWGSEIGRAHV